jgi:hypothetical protein
MYSSYFVGMRRRRGRFLAGPERHLASVRSIEYVPFDSRRSLMMVLRNPICRVLHEFGKVVHWHRDIVPFLVRVPFLPLNARIVS